MSVPIPFLDEKKQQASVTVHEMDPIDPGLIAAAFDLIAAVSSKDTAKVAHALKNFFELCDSEPHEEGPHTLQNALESTKQPLGALPRR